MGLFGRLFGKRNNIAGEQWQLPFVQEICIAIIQQIPEDWNSAFLVLEVPEHGLGRGLAHSAIMETRAADFALTDGEFVTPDMAVMTATRQFELAWVERLKTFKQAVVFRRAILSATRDGEDWVVKSDYEYD